MFARALCLWLLCSVMSACFSSRNSAYIAGAVGPSGKDGENGKDGAKGETGSTGPKGDVGEVGSTGPTGETVAEGQNGFTGATGPSGEANTEPQGLALRRAPWRGDERFELIWRKVDGAAYYRVEIIIGGLRRDEVVADTALEVALAPNTGLWTFRVVPIDFEGAEGRASHPFVFDTDLRFWFVTYGETARQLQVLSTTGQPFDTQASLWDDATNRADRGYGSPDGRSLAFQTWTSSSMELRVADLAAGTSRVLRSMTDGFWLLPAWSPDARFIAGLHSSFAKPLGTTVEVIDTASGALVLALPDAPVTLFEGTLSWSSDGRFLACSGPEGITVFDIMTRTTRVVKPGATAIAPLRWNPRYPVLSATTSTSIVFYDAEASRVFDRAERVAGAAAWSPDGTRAIYVSNALSEGPRLHVTTFDATTDTVLLAPGPLHGISLNFAWARDSRAVYLVLAEPGPAPVTLSMLRVSITGGAETLFASKSRTFGIHGSSMHRYLAMTRSGASGLELMFLDQLSGALTTAFSSTIATTALGGGAWSWDGSRFGASLRGGVDSPAGTTSAAVLLFSPDAPALALPKPIPKNDDAFDVLGWVGLP